MSCASLQIKASIRGTFDHDETALRSRDWFRRNRNIDHRKPFIVCRPLAEQGVSLAQNALGEMYMYGEGIAQDYNEAAKWFRLAADQGQRRAQFLLGVLYWSGDGVPHDFDAAVKWFRLADNR